MPLSMHRNRWEMFLPSGTDMTVPKAWGLEVAVLRPLLPHWPLIVSLADFCDRCTGVSRARPLDSSVLTAQVSASRTVLCLLIPWGSCQMSDVIKVGLHLRFCVSPELPGDVGAAGPGRTIRVARPRRTCVISSRCLLTLTPCHVLTGPDLRLRHASRT